MRCGSDRSHIYTKAKGALARGVSALRGAAILALVGAGPAAASVQQRTSGPTSLVFDGVTVIDVEHGKLIADQRVVITGHRIQALGGAGAVQLPPGARVVDARGKYLIPGLWDMHAHASADGDTAFALRGYQLDLAFGVTGVRDPGTTIPLAMMIQWRREILAGTRVGPPRQILSDRGFDSCWLQGVPGMGAGRYCLNDSATAAQDATRLIDSLKAAGLDMIKMYQLASTDYFAVAAAARRAGVRFGGHLFQAPPIPASDSGASIVDHVAGTNIGALLYWQCFGRDTTPLTWAKPEYTPGTGQASVERCRPVAEAFRRNNTWVQLGPSASYSRRLTRQRDSVVTQFWAGALPTGNWLGHAPPAPLPLEPWERDQDVTFRIASQVGLPVLAGTDAGALPKGFVFHTELAVMVALGLTPLQALQAATLNPAKMFNGTDSLGTVAAGKLADLVLLDANPLEDITNTTTIRAVVADGRYFDRAALDNLLIEVRAAAKTQP